jgi:type III secretion protein N (ATPase)
MGVGQRVGVFAPAGAGKSTLLGMIARHARADVVVVALVGERGREVREFLEVELEPATKSRCVAVVATSDEPVLLRRLAACVATTVAEYFRDRGADVLLLVDSITRHVRALRDVALAAGEPPGRGGFPPSVFSGLPGLLERTGQSEHGSITAIYSVLVDSLDLTDPVGDEVRAVLDGHIVLSREIAGRGTYPAIDISASTSRVMDRVVDGDHLAAARRLRSLIAAYERDRDLVMLGAYEQGADPLLDEAVARADEIAELLQQVPAESSQFRATRERLLELAVPLAATGGLSVQD